MLRSELLSSLSLGTLIVVAAIIAIVLALFLRRRSNRRPLEGRVERNVGAEIDAGKRAPDRSSRG